jgi:hypothetical protein
MNANLFFPLRTQRFLWIVAGLSLIQGAANPAADPSSPGDGFAFESRDGVLAISYGGQRVADYVYRDDRIWRPYFANVHAPGGFQATRNHPPIPGRDATDHDTMHPGLWLAFGDISGQDYWRNKGRIEHVRFAEPAAIRAGRLEWVTDSHLLSTNGQPLGRLVSRFTLTARPEGYLVIWDASFEAGQQDLAFGDQEEMGFGVRVATGLTERNGGLLTSSTGRKTATSTWGQAAEWCDYSGTVEGRRVGVTLVPDPAHFRASWWHNRDYGLMVANPFGRKAMNQGEPSRVIVRKGERLRLRFGVLVHSSPADETFDPAVAYRAFIQLVSEER